MNRNHDTEALEAAVWAAAEGRASADQLELIDADRPRSSRVVDGLLADTQARLESVHGLTGPERTQVIADFAEELEGLRRVYDRLHGDDDDAYDVGDVIDVVDEPGVVLQASWSDDEVVVWAAGRTGRARDQRGVGGPSGTSRWSCARMARASRSDAAKRCRL